MIYTADDLEFVIGMMTYKNERLNWEADGSVSTHQLCSNRYEFEIIQDEIDIDSIEEITTGIICDERDLKINQLIKAVKQLNKRLEE